MTNFYADRAGGNAIEHILLNLCRAQGIRAELNPAPDPDLAPDEQIAREWYQARAAYDIRIADLYCDVKADWLSWSTRNICVEAESLKHTAASHFIYAFPRPSSLVFHVFAVQELIALYNAKTALRRDDGSTYERWQYEHKVQSGDQAYNPVCLLPMQTIQTVGQNFWAFTEALKQAA